MKCRYAQTALKVTAVRAALMSVDDRVGCYRRFRIHCRRSRLWKNNDHRRLYITGAIGSFADEEKFGPDYMLRTIVTAKLCSIANAFFDSQMNQATGDAPRWMN